MRGTVLHNDEDEDDSHPLSISYELIILSILKNLFIYLVLATLGLHCCAWALFSCGEQGWL